MRAVRLAAEILRACETIDAMVLDYNDVRLHAALGYIEPKEAHFGDLELRREVRAERLNVGRQLRREKNRAMAA